MWASKILHINVDNKAWYHMALNLPGQAIQESVAPDAVFAGD